MLKSRRLDLSWRAFIIFCILAALNLRVNAASSPEFGDKLFRFLSQGVLHETEDTRIPLEPGVSKTSAARSSSGAPHLIADASAGSGNASNSSDEAQEGAETAGSPRTGEGTRVNYESDKADIIDLGKKLRFEGRVQITTENAEFSADEIDYDAEKNTFRATGLEPGGVRMKRDGGSLTADEVIYDVESETGELTNCSGTFDQLLFHAPLVKRTGPNSAELVGGHVTTCDLDKPHYRVVAERIEVTDEQELSARNATFYLGPVPILRVPRFSHAVGETRFPINIHTGHESELGYFLRTEYEFDVTEKFSGGVHADVYTDEGFGTGLDGSLTAVEGGETTFKTYMTTKERGRAEIYHTQEMPRDWRAILQLEQWTDEDFLEEFYYDEYKRRTEPETFLNLTRTKPYDIISLTVRKRTNGFVDETERLPELNVTFLERQIGATPFYYSVENSAGYLVDRPGEEHTLRNFTSGRLSYAGRPARWLSVVPFIGVDGTYYSDGLVEDDLYRTSPLSGVTLGTRLHKVYGSRSGNYSAFKHVIVPTLTYTYRPTPDVRTTEIHEFDAIDNVVGGSRIGFELDNLFLSKTNDGEQRQFARLTLYSGTDITSEQEESVDWAARLQVSPWDRFGFEFDADSHDAEEDFKLFNGSFYYRPEERGGPEIRLGFGYSETESGVFNEDVSYYFGTNLGQKWRVSLEHRYDFHDNELEYQEYRIWRDLHCFEGGISYRIREKSERVLIMIGLKAFPGAEVKF
jgi:hypothetical protein